MLYASSLLSDVSILPSAEETGMDCYSISITPQSF